LLIKLYCESYKNYNLESLGQQGSIEWCDVLEPSFQWSVTFPPLYSVEKKEVVVKKSRAVLDFGNGKYLVHDDRDWKGKLQLRDLNSRELKATSGDLYSYRANTLAKLSENAVLVGLVDYIQVVHILDDKTVLLGPELKHDYKIINQIQKCSQGDNAIIAASSKGLIKFCIKDSSVISFVRKIKDGDFYSVFEYDEEKFICSEWEKPGYWLYDQTTGKFERIEDLDKGWHPFIVPLHGYSYNNFPYLVGRSYQHISLIDVKGKKTYTLQKSEHIYDYLQKSIEVGYNPETGELKLIYREKGAKFFVKTYPKSFYENLKAANSL